MVRSADMVIVRPRYRPTADETATFVSVRPKGTIKYCPTVPNSALDRDRDTVEACRLVPGMRCRPGYKNVYLIERFDEGSTSRSNRPPGPSAVTTSSSSPRPDHASIERSTRSYASAASVDDGNRGW